ncbi:MAG: response regulator [Dokdonella sp.]
MPYAGVEMHAATLQPEREIVFVVDDDASMLAAIRRVLISANYEVEGYASGAALLEDARLDHPQCLLLDMLMPGMSGLEVQAALNQRQVRVPIIFITGHAEVPIAVEAMRQGAFDFIEKPFGNDDLIVRVRRAIRMSRQRQQQALLREDALLKLTSLTPRETEVLQLIVSGKTSKEVARALGGSHRTVDIHRGRIMKKTATSTLAGLVRLCAAADEGIRVGLDT